MKLKKELRRFLVSLNEIKITENNDTSNEEEPMLVKARAGRYEDTPENRRLHRVGQQYGQPAKPKEEDNEATRHISAIQNKIDQMKKNSSFFIKYKGGQEKYDKALEILENKKKELQSKITVKPESTPTKNNVSDKKKLIEKVEKLISEKNKKFPNPDIGTPMSDEEKRLTREIADTWSELNKIVRENNERKNETESTNLQEPPKAANQPETGITSRIKFDDIPNSGKVNMKKYLSDKIKREVNEAWKDISKIDTASLKKMEQGLIEDFNRQFDDLSKSRRAEKLYSIMKIKAELNTRSKDLKTEDGEYVGYGQNRTLKKNLPEKFEDTQSWLVGKAWLQNKYGENFKGSQLTEKEIDHMINLKGKEAKSSDFNKKSFKKDKEVAKILEDDTKLDSNEKIEEEPARPKPKYKKETEKAVLMTIVVDAEVAPMGGFTSSLVRDKRYVMDVWIPKSQLSENGIPSDWITKIKSEEVLDKKAIGVQVLNSSSTYSDMEGNTFYPEAKNKEVREFLKEVGSKKPKEPPLTPTEGKVISRLKRLTSYEFNVETFGGDKIDMIKVGVKSGIGGSETIFVKDYSPRALREIGKIIGIDIPTENAGNSEDGKKKVK